MMKTVFAKSSNRITTTVVPRRTRAINTHRVDMAETMRVFIITEGRGTEGEKT